MPSSLVQHQYCMAAWQYGLTDCFQVKCHRLGIGKGQHKANCHIALRAVLIECTPTHAGSRVIVDIMVDASIVEALRQSFSKEDKAIVSEDAMPADWTPPNRRQKDMDTLDQETRQVLLRL